MKNVASYNILADIVCVVGIIAIKMREILDMREVLVSEAKGNDVGGKIPRIRL